MSYSLEIEKVTKVFGDNIAVNEISAKIPAGSIYGFLGPNGAGKTTTIRMIMSILYPDQGTIRLFGDRSPEHCKDKLGYLPEEKGLYKKMRTAEVIAYFGRLKGMSRGAARTKAMELLETFGLLHCADKRCDALSKGMGQKIQIIATLLHEPDLVILDEPFSGLDPINVEVVRDVILGLKRAGKTVIFSTHVMEQAEQICDFILLINKGQKILDGSLADVKKSGHQTIRLEYEGDGSFLQNIPGVNRINDMGKAAELSLEPETNAQEILAKLVPQVSLRSFTVNDPSLHEIFVRSVGESPE